MAADLAALRNAFKKAVDDFNRDDFKLHPENYTNQLQGSLAPNVIMKRIDEGGYYDESLPGPDGKTPQVTFYFLHGNGADDKATFTPDQSANPPIQPEFQIVDSIGFVSGTGTFVDTTGSPARRIAYVFAFSSASGQWKAIFLWGKDKKYIHD